MYTVDFITSSNSFDYERKNVLTLNYPDSYTEYELTNHIALDILSNIEWSSYENADELFVYINGLVAGIVDIRKQYYFTTWTGYPETIYESDAKRHLGIEA